MVNIRQKAVKITLSHADSRWGNNRRLVVVVFTAYQQTVVTPVTTAYQQTVVTLVTTVCGNSSKHCLAADGGNSSNQTGNSSNHCLLLEVVILVTTVCQQTLVNPVTTAYHQTLVSLLTILSTSARW